MKNKGFTLIELLVVVSVIGVLATIIAGTLSDARARARDVKRELHMREIQTALELYNIDNGHYPFPLGGWAYSATNTQNSFNNQVSSSWLALEEELGIDLPIDPLNTGLPAHTSVDRYGYGYFTLNNSGHCFGARYLLIYRPELKTPENSTYEFCTYSRSLPSHVAVLQQID